MRGEDGLEAEEQRLSKGRQEIREEVTEGTGHGRGEKADRKNE